MNMNELKGKYVNIVLCIEEGRGFDLVKCPFSVVANFNGRKMESDVVNGGAVVFCTEIVWETEKKLLRKARVAYSNIRLECVNSERKSIGFTLLSLRSAKVVPACNPNTTEPSTAVWIKLISVPVEYRRSNPELLINLLIRDYVPNVPLKSQVKKSNMAPHLPKQQSDHFKQARVPVKYADEGYIQLGYIEECCTKFQLKFTLQTGCDLDVLLPESIIFGKSSATYHLTLEVFGLEVSTRKVAEDVFAQVTVFNEAIVINMISNYNMVGIYFNQFPNVHVKFFVEDRHLAWADVDMKKLNLDLPEAIFYECNQKFEMEQICFFEGHYRATTSAEVMRRATIAVECKLEAVDYFEVEFSHEYLGLAPNNETNLSDSGEDTACGGAAAVSNKGDVKEDYNLPAVNNNDDCASSHKLIACDLAVADQHHQFLLELKVEAITWKDLLPPRSCLLKLSHPLVDKTITKELQVKDSNERVIIDKVWCTLSVVSLQSRLNYMLMNYTPKVELLDLSTEENLGRMANSDFSTLYSDAPGSISVIPIVTPSGAELATLEVALYAKVNDLSAEPPAMFHLSPCILDDSIIMHSLRDLQDWITAKKQEFEMIWTEEKDAEMKRMREEWREKTSRLEEELETNISKCRTLLERHEKKKIREDVKEDLNTRMNDQEYSVAIEIHKNSIKFSTADKQELIEAISDLEVRNAILREMLTDTTHQMEMVKKSQLTAEQTTVLLKDLKIMEEKYEVAQKDKNYFKCEYEKALKEVHNMRMDYHRNIADKIATEKKALTTYVDNPNAAPPQRRETDSLVTIHSNPTVAIGDLHPYITDYDSDSSDPEQNKTI